MNRAQPVADLVVVGSGVAGLTAAIAAREAGLQVLLVTKGAISDGNTRWAQGGVAVVLPRNGDCVTVHAADTVAAGGGLCDERATRLILRDGPAAVDGLQDQGAEFDRSATGELMRTREGGHHIARVIHAGGDATGAEIERALVAASRDGGVPVLEHHAITDVLTDSSRRVAGVALVDRDGRTTIQRARSVLLATGGAGQLYTATTNPEVATGDGVAAALRAGATASDLEFVQFHPTVLYAGNPGRGRRPLVTEAVRGEGGVLLDLTGVRIMDGVHPLGDLAPRDVVAAAITRRLADTATDHVLLDATGIPRFSDRFPTVAAACRDAGIEPSREPIPVRPAAHYLCGGVETDTDGRTTLAGLYAAGEVARTGLHGANRLASNSLLEGLVVGRRAVRAICADLPLLGVPGEPVPVPAYRPVVARAALQDAMTAHVAIGRDAAGLAQVEKLMATAVDQRIDSISALEDSTLTLVAAAIVAAATERTETRGCHIRLDHPNADPALGRSIEVRLDDAGRPVAQRGLAAAAIDGAA